MKSKEIYKLISQEIRELKEAGYLPAEEQAFVKDSPSALKQFPLKWSFGLKRPSGEEELGFSPEVHIYENFIRSHCVCSDYARQRSCEHIVQALEIIRDGLEIEQGERIALEEELARDKAGDEGDKPLEAQPSSLEEREGMLEIDTSRSGMIPFLDFYYSKGKRPMEILAFNPSLPHPTMKLTDGKHNIQLTHLPEQRRIRTHCDCKLNGRQSNLCEHVRAALARLYETHLEHVFSPEWQEELLEGFALDHGMSLMHLDRLELVPVGGMRLGVQVRGGNVLHSAEELLSLLPEPEEREEREEIIHGNLTSLELRGQAPVLCFIFHMINEAKQFAGLSPCLAKAGKDGLPINRFRPIERGDYLDLEGLLSAEEQRLVSAALRCQFGSETYLVEEEEYRHFRYLVSHLEGVPCYLYDQMRSLTLKNLKPLELRDEAAELVFVLGQDKTGDLILTPHLEIGDKRYTIGQKASPRLSTYGVQLKGNTLCPWASVLQAESALTFELRGQIKILEQDVERLLPTLLPALSRQHRIYDERPGRQGRRAKAPFERELYFDEEEALIKIQPIARYGAQLIPLYSPEVLEAEEGSSLERDFEGEAEFLSLIQGLHADFEGGNGIFFLSPGQLLENDWMLHRSRMLERKGVRLYGTEGLSSFRINIHSPSLHLGLSSGTDWFDLKVKVAFGKQLVSLQEIKRSLTKRSRYVQLGDGSLGLLPEEWLRKLSSFLRAGEVRRDQIRLSAYQFNILDELYESLEVSPEELGEALERKRRLQQIGQIKSIETPRGIKAQLRDYQHEGLSWLVFLEEYGLGGCLADDMGLGKTLQTIAFLTHLKERGGYTEPHLVVAPTSLVFNWEAELRKFAPGLSFMRYTGSERKQIEEGSWEGIDLVLTTYGTLINDIEQLRQRLFGYVILDEAQAIKNPASKRYKAVRLLRSRGRLSLTGTPIENNTFDLYTQMHFLNPGLLGGMEHFRREFALPIDRDRNEEAAQLLSRIIHPFMLRRTKRQVATELPEKVEDIIYCEMGSEQRRIYERTKERIRQQLLSLVEEEGEQRAQIHVLQGLMQLRQICNSPALVEGSTMARHTAPSVKIDLLIRKLHDLVHEHKVLVFSQFTSMLSLVGDRLSEEGIRYTYLDGSSTDRQTLVEEFQENEEQRVFLISLKAGGTGLNLTAADYVFLIDPWWNPAVENQAIDRCYRIGQTKHVMAYRMICKDSIEEKILQLQDNKREVSESVIQTDLGHKHFDRAQIAELFA